LKITKGLQVLIRLLCVCLHKLNFVHAHGEGSGYSRWVIIKKN
jgi:hypothetical protein